ncbi:unnamed protein product [marine sediment metagenome]|uniref:Uncharacterized protein n=1 Tax=marine sediment metagenome TaxID=412755 RepID=X1U1I6_9ZZZZ
MLPGKGQNILNNTQSNIVDGSHVERMGKTIMIPVIINSNPMKMKHALNISPMGTKSPKTPFITYISSPIGGVMAPIKVIITIIMPNQRKSMPWVTIMGTTKGNVRIIIATESKKQPRMI